MSLWQYVPSPRLPPPPPSHHHHPTPLTTQTRTYTNLTPKTRLMIGVGIMAWSGIGLLVSDTAEKKLGYEATEADRERLRDALPRVRFVEKEEEK